MRKELQNFDWHTYGLSLSDFDNTFKVVQDIVGDRKQQLEQKIQQLEVYDGDGKLIDKSTGEADEAIDDVAYYNHIENLYLWHFGLWRLQGVFEGILKQEFFPHERLQGGLKAKLGFIRKRGLKIEDSDYKEVLDWAKLRNALSHHPPEQYSPCWLEEDDLKAYKELTKRVTADLLRQKETNTITTSMAR